VSRFRFPGLREAAWGEDDLAVRMAADIRDRLAYCATGRLIHRFGKTCGKTAGGLSGNGYFTISVLGKNIGLHRAIWAYHNGALPPDGMVIDHINGDPKDNRIENLRLATYAQNLANKTKAPRGKQRMFGVSFNKDAKRFRSQLRVNGKRVHIGYFDTAEEAVAAYEAKGREIYGQFWSANK